VLFGEGQFFEAVLEGGFAGESVVREGSVEV
jgi:hypothetical protein